jgi:hypothetical protein
VPSHEGWVGNVLADGRTTSATDADGVLIVTPNGNHEHVPWDQVVAWRVMCECGWTGPSVPAFTDPECGTRDCPDELADELMESWTRHTRPSESLAELGKVCAEMSRLTARAEELVRTARGGGISWGQIGAVAGLTRQGAAQRWRSIA